MYQLSTLSCYKLLGQMSHLSGLRVRSLWGHGLRGHALRLLQDQRTLIPLQRILYSGLLSMSKPHEDNADLKVNSLTKFQNHIINTHGADIDHVLLFGLRGHVPTFNPIMLQSTRGILTASEAEWVI